ncbi:MAG: DNA-directed RNA polymerase subunit alpha [Candidatus Moranbacteria bacterium CG2_30_45_14]|nr:MAG: DNA-directed RNA polymerase subunit alpha [Candidatus Moranbacteria bacterium CG2_30_45_14]
MFPVNGPYETGPTVHPKPQNGMQIIASPLKPKYTALGTNHGKFEILGCYPGYGTTVGNALRRVLLSSLDGAAAKSIKIKGVSHEFSTIPGVMEDVVQIILNLKQVRFNLHGDETVKITLKSKGEGVLTAAQFKTSSDVEVVNPDQIIATITDKKTEFEMEVEVDKGIGYVPVESREREDYEIDVIAIDSIYTPVKRVNYEIENMRVGKRTDYDKVTLEVVTDGSISPVEAFEKSVAILVSQFSSLTEVEGDIPEVKETAVEGKSAKGGSASGGKPKKVTKKKSAKADKEGAAE